MTQQLIPPWNRRLIAVAADTPTNIRIGPEKCEGDKHIHSADQPANQQGAQGERALAPSFTSSSDASLLSTQEITRANVLISPISIERAGNSCASNEYKPQLLHLAKQRLQDICEQ
jgi:hypothetical protein